jgi:hypothetical protein
VTLWFVLTGNLTDKLTILKAHIIYFNWSAYSIRRHFFQSTNTITLLLKILANKKWKIISISLHISISAIFSCFTCRLLTSAVLVLSCGHIGLIRNIQHEKGYRYWQNAPCMIDGRVEYCSIA